MRVRFLGVRGSVPWSVPASVAHGCNTPCLEVTDERTGAVLILDAGSGIVGLSLDAHGPRGEASVLLTHYHWDHLLGLPFFGALYQPGWSIGVYTPSLQSHDPAWLDTIFKSTFFPVPYQSLPNLPVVRMIDRESLRMPGFDVRAIELNHPGGALAYRIRGSHGDLVYATDHEFGDPRYDVPLADFARGAAAIVLDAHFTPEERPRFTGWGHSDWRDCAEFARANGIGRLYLFHHKPGRTDDELDRIVAEARTIFPATDAAAEGTTIDL